MENEIKEILNRFDFVKKEPNKLSYYPEDLLTRREMWLLYDCITNLQEENKELKAKLEMYENGVYYSSENDKLQEKIDKAIEYIEHENYKRTLLGFSEHKYLKNIQEKLLDILKGSDKE